MKRTLISLALLLFALVGGVNAQVLLRYGDGIGNGWGDGSIVVTPYVQFPESFVSPYAGNQITRVRIGLCQPATNVYVYIKNTPQDSKPLYRQKVGTLDAGWNDVVLDTPFDIAGTGSIAIGYKASFANKNGVGCSNVKFNDVNAKDADIVYFNSDNRWTATGTPLCIQAYVEGKAMPSDYLRISSLADITASYDASEVTFKGSVRNVGINAVSGYSLCYELDGEKSYLDIDRQVDVNDVDSFTITVPSTEKGTHLLKVMVNSVNGNTATYLTNDTAKATLTVLDPAFRRRVVCEEYTGLWCGWCPKGLVGLELMKEKYPFTFIPISAHGGDALEIKDSIHSYSTFIKSCSGAPLCNVNRRATGDPFADILMLYGMEQSVVNHVAYNVSAEWNEDSTAVNVTSDFFSDIDIPKPKYSIAYTITEDSITGYRQTNYYGGKSEEFYGWEKKEEITDDVVFNDLARGIYPSYAGELCRTEPMVANEHYTHSYNIPLPDNVRDRRNIKIVGQIIDSATGYIVNAMACKPVRKGTLGVCSVTDDSNVRVCRTGEGCRISVGGVCHAEVYNATGVLVDSRQVEGTAVLRAPQRGLALVRVSKDGHVIKVFKLK